MTEQELLQRVYAHIGNEEKSGLVEPVVLAMADLAFIDLAKLLIENKPSLAKKLISSVANQTWASSSFSAPTDMLYNMEKTVIRLDLGGTLCHQLEDRDKLDMIGTTLSNHYYALEGKTFYIKHASGTASGSNLNLRYYKVPTVTDVDDELTTIFLDILFTRLGIVRTSEKPNEPKRPNTQSKQ